MTPSRVFRNRLRMQGTVNIHQLCSPEDRRGNPQPVKELVDDSFTADGRPARCTDSTEMRETESHIAREETPSPASDRNLT